MLHIELHKRVPQAHQEIDLAWVLTTFELCRSLFTKPEEIQSEMIFLRTQKPQPPVCLLIDYRPKGSCLRVQLFVQNGHNPFLSYICYPDIINERGYTHRFVEEQPYDKAYRPYLGAITNKLEWKLVESDAPRRLYHLDRELIPIYRKELIVGLGELTDKASRAKSDRWGSETALLYNRRTTLLMQFLRTKAVVSGFNQEELSYPFVNNLRDNYSFVINFFRSCCMPNWSAEDEGRWLEHFFRAFDPAVKDASNDETQSDLRRQWIAYCAELGTVTETTPDPLNIGGWALKA